ncbi:hypothetical protein CERZMDRAFT_97705 [Cercospora zeae-maydis SCOH1-5]|uniref:Uncharacterized protein n=1 Tax=Cercospora zeae-maydis SCOH1-5 TaxID=717836 RepID=A0A6A6FGC2_9PEZI|nr:hypothetical protein CERZMDRAFT_97705 [Cercospora zeae-maydis SCOH1-5]
MSFSLLQIVRPYETEQEMTRQEQDAAASTSQRDTQTCARRVREAATEAVSFPNMMDASASPPPPYTQTIPGSIQQSSSTNAGSNSPNTLFVHNHHQQPPPQAPNDLPIVIPQIARSSEGSFHSPFIRSYPPSLHPQISQTDFLAFLDTLNSVWVADPTLQSVGLAGEIMGNLFWLPIVPFVGMGVEIAAGLSSVAASLARSRKFLKVANEKLWKPRGWFVKVCGTKEMLGRVGYASGGEGGAAKLKLPPRVVEDELERAEEGDDSRSGHQHQVPREENARTRRMRALEGYVAPLEFNVPALVSPDNFLAKMGTAQAQRMASKQQKKEAQKRGKAIEKQHQQHREAEKSSQNAAVKLAELEALLEKERDRFHAKVKRRGEGVSEKDRERIFREFEKEEERLEKDLEKERKRAGKEREKRAENEEEHAAKPKKDKEEEATQKMRWIVITRWDEGRNKDEGEAELVVGDDANENGKWEK